jgi:hypothetical protein
VVTHLTKEGDPANTTLQNIETQTALLKVYVYAGDINKAWLLFQRIDHPNVRTFNTLLRGCLWTATSIGLDHANSNDENKSSITNVATNAVGGVVTSEMAWQRYCPEVPSNSVDSGNNSRGNINSISSLADTSSYEYAVTLLCQALRVEEAVVRIHNFCTIHRISFKGTAKIAYDFVQTGDSAVVETFGLIVDILSTLFECY